MNFLAAILILFVAYLVFATQVTQGQYTIKDVRAGSAADQVGFKAEDVVLSANGVDMTQHIDPNSAEGLSILPLKQQAINSIGKTFTAEVLRTGADGQKHKVELKGTIPADTNTDAPLGRDAVIGSYESRTLFLYARSVHLHGYGRCRDSHGAAWWKCHCSSSVAA